ncbi:MAG: type I DNA topoisomerase [Patescibacteria group bacterium]|jgi:DNA topoisomerase-1
MTRLLIVESPTKAKTIKKILGPAYTVVSSFGHVRDLPERKMGIDFANGFTPEYVVPSEKKEKVATLKAAAKNAKEIYLATDADREGEAIAWHIAEILHLKPEEVHRIAFHEITKHAIEEALKHPGKLAMDLVDAQQTRRILDRIVGYELSPFLWKKIRRGLSAGRVQSVAVRLIVERERERLAFKQEEYWSIDAIMKKDGKEFEAHLVEDHGKKLDKLDIKNEAMAKEIVDRLLSGPFAVKSVETKEMKKKAPTPLTTSSLQQEANNRLHFTAKETMALAQKLYETGRITYMRTDSFNLAEKFLGEAQVYLQSAFGKEYAKGTITYKTKSKGAQEAHEAIRPTDPASTPQSLQGELEAKQWKLYDLIWRRTLASQMPPAILQKIIVDVAGNDGVLRANGSSIQFDGFMKIYRGAKETFLPEMKKGEAVEAKEIIPNQHMTEPPARYSDATLVKTLEEYEIGRPSTYAPTIGTIIDRGYVERDENQKLYPTDTAMTVNDLLVKHFPDIVDFEFTAKMEKTLDTIAEGKEESAPALKAFYTPFHKNILEKTKEVSHEEVMPTKELGEDPKTKLQVFLRTGRFGPYLQLGEWSEEDRKAKINKPKSVSIPKNLSQESVTLEQAIALLSLPREVGVYEGAPITVQYGPYGAYMKSGKVNVTLPEPFDPLTIEKTEAERIFTEGAAYKKEHGGGAIQTFESDKKTISVKTGRFGPYVTDGKVNASIPEGTDPKTITKEEAEALLKAKKSYKRFKKTTEKTEAIKEE